MNDLITHCDEKAERFMRNGQWDLAKETYIGCHCLAASELTLRLATLEWRRDCALYIERTLDRPVPFDVFMRDISSRYDAFIADWISQNYLGIKTFWNGNTYCIARRFVQ